MIVILMVLAVIVIIQVFIIKKFYITIKQLRVKTELLTQIIEMDGEKHEKTDSGFIS